MSDLSLALTRIRESSANDTELGTAFEISFGEYFRNYV